MRNRGKLALALMLMLAFGAAFASTAVAKYDFEKSSVTLEATNENSQVFKTKFGNIKCNKAVYKSIQGGTFVGANAYTAEHLKLHPAYSDCSALGFPATVDTGECNYTFTPPTKTDPTGPHAEMDIVPISGSTCTIDVDVAGGLCPTTIANQAGIGLADFMNLSAGSDSTRDVTIDSTVTAIDYSGIGAFCVGTGSDGTLEGAMTLRAFDLTGQVGVWVTNT